MKFFTPSNYCQIRISLEFQRNKIEYSRTHNFPRNCVHNCFNCRNSSSKNREIPSGHLLLHNLISLMQKCVLTWKHSTDLGQVTKKAFQVIEMAKNCNIFPQGRCRRGNRSECLIASRRKRNQGSKWNRWGIHLLREFLHIFYKIIGILYFSSCHSYKICVNNCFCLDDNRLTHEIYRKTSHRETQKRKTAGETAIHINQHLNGAIKNCYFYCFFLVISMVIRNK